MKSIPKGNFKNILAQAVKPSRFLTMFKKVRRRISDQKGRHDALQNQNWLQSNCTDFDKLACDLDPDLWNETKKASENLERNAKERLDQIEHNLGGGGAYPFLYFVTRYMEPDCVVETGVAAGFSSYSFLAAIEANGKGRLFSSDFPYFRLPNPERFIGIVVDEKLKAGWDLFIEGDEVNLPKIAKMVDEIDIFHYDSDKSFFGRAYAISIVTDLLSQRGIVLMDDIQDNSFFYDLVEESKPDSWFVFEFQNKYVGMIGMPTRPPV